MSTRVEEPGVETRPSEAETEGPLGERDPSDSGAAVGLKTAAPQDYVREGERGRGGRGRVVAARDLRLDRPVAIKEPLHSLGRAEEARFVREAMVTARLQHPGIVPVYEAGRWPDGTPFYAMKLVSGEPLSDIIGATGSLAERLALLPSVLAVAEAMAYAHDEGVIHRDLKPSNVLVGEYGETVVVDWGLAKDLGADDWYEGGASASLSAIARSDMTATGAILGTPSYMPPEQARGEPVDERADVYALGAMLYHLLAGEPPYRGDSAEAIFSLILDGAVVPIAERVPEVPADLAAIIGKAMRSDPDMRYPSAREFAVDLRRFQTGQLVGVYRYGIVELARRWVGRHRAAVAVAAIATVVLLAVALVSATRVVRERDRAEARSAELTLAHARSALESDPTASLAWLPHYPLAEGETEPAQVAIDALSRGVSSQVFRLDNVAITKVAVSNDGKYVAALGDDGVAVWESGTGEQVFFEPLEAAFRLAFSPTSKQIAVATYTGDVRTVELPAGFVRPLASHETWVESLKYSDDGSRLVSTWEDGAIRGWDARTGRERTLGKVEGPARDVGFLASGEVAVVDGHGVARAIEWGHESARIVSPAALDVTEMAVSASGTEVAIASGNAVALFSSQGELVQLGRHDTRVLEIEFASGGTAIATASEDGELRWWSAQRAAPWRHRKLVGHEVPVTSIAFSPNGRALASVDERGEVRIWSHRGEVARRLGHRGRVLAVAFSASGRFLVTGGEDGTVRVWEAPEPPTRLHADGPDVFQFAFSADGERVTATSRDGGVRVFEIDEGRARMVGQHKSVAYSLALSPAGRHLITSAWNGDVTKWDLASGVSQAFPPLTWTWDVAISPDGELVAAAGVGGAYVASVSDGRPLWRSDDVGETRVLRWSPDGARLAIASRRNGLFVYGRDDAALRRVSAVGGEFRTGHMFRDGRRFATTNSEGHVALWELETGTHRLLGAHDQMVRALAVSPDERLVATGSADRTIRIWNIESGASQVWRGHTAEVRDLAFSPDGQWLASGGLDSVVRVWDVASGRSWPFYGHEGRIHRVGWAPDGKTIASSSQDGSIGLWKLEDVHLAPLEPTALRAWLAEQTTAVIGPDQPLATPRDIGTARATPR